MDYRTDNTSDRAHRVLTDPKSGWRLIPGLKDSYPPNVVALESRIARRSADFGRQAKSRSSRPPLRLAESRQLVLHALTLAERSLQGTAYLVLDVPDRLALAPFEAHGRSGPSLKVTSPRRLSEAIYRDGTEVGQLIVWQHGVPAGPAPHALRDDVETLQIIARQIEQILALDAKLERVD